VALSDTALSTHTELKLLTMNIWIKPKKLDERMTGLCDLMKSTGADIVLLQEVTPESYETILANNFVQKTFYATSLDGQETKSKSKAKTAILSRLLPCSAAVQDNPLHPRRSMLAQFNFAGDAKHTASTLSVGSVHLCSEEAEIDERSFQATYLFSKLNPGSTNILAGDWNIHHESENGWFGSNGVTDVWAKLRPKEEGYTFDGRHNWFASLTSSTPRRLDRIAWRPPVPAQATANTKTHVSALSAHVAPSWQPTSINIVGQHPVGHYKHEGHPIHVSDHYGLFCTLQLR